MKTKLLILLILIVLKVDIYAQTYNTSYSKSVSSSFCGEENFGFIFSYETIVKIDREKKSKESIISKRISGNYDNNGHYVEIWNSKFFLDKFGISRYDQISKFSYKIGYSKKGGDLLYVLEIRDDTGVKDGKLYLTNKGYQLICQ